MMHSPHAPAAAAEIRRLRDLLAERDAEIEQLRAALTGDLRTPPEWGLTKTEERFVLALRHGRVMTYEALLTAVYQLADSEPDAKTITAHASKIRRKLRRHAPSIRIMTVWGRGLVLASASVPLLAASLCAPEERKAAAPAQTKPAPVPPPPAPPPPPPLWNDDTTALLIRHKRDGRTAARIAGILTRSTGKKVTRSAVLGRLFRLKAREEARHA